MIYFFFPSGASVECVSYIVILRLILKNPLMRGLFSIAELLKGSKTWELC